MNGRWVRAPIAGAGACRNKLYGGQECGSVTAKVVGLTAQICPRCDRVDLSTPKKA